MSKAKFADVYKKYMPLYKDSLMTPPVAQEPQGALPYNPIDAAKRSAYASADLAAQRQNALAEQQRQVSVIDAQRAYERSLPTYGSAAERYLSAGLSGSGFTDYAAANAYATMRGEVSAARATENAAKQDVMYQRMAAYQNADQAAMQAQNEVYSQLLQAVYGGGLSADDVKRVAGHYGLSDASMVGALQDAAKFYAEKEQAAYKQAQQDLQDRITAAQDMSAEDAEAYAAQFYDVGSAGYEAVVKAQEQAEYNKAALQQQTSLDWSIKGYNPKQNNDAFTLTINGAEYKVKVGNDVERGKTASELNKQATGDENTPPSVSVAKGTHQLGSSEYPQMLQVYDGQMYIYKDGWRKIEGRDANLWKRAIASIAAGPLAPVANLAVPEKKQNMSVVASELEAQKIEALYQNKDMLTESQKENLKAYAENTQNRVKEALNDGSIFAGETKEDSAASFKTYLSSSMLDDATKVAVAEAFSNSVGGDGIKKLLGDKKQSVLKYVHDNYYGGSSHQYPIKRDEAVSYVKSYIAGILNQDADSEAMNALVPAIRQYLGFAN